MLLGLNIGQYLMKIECVKFTVRIEGHIIEFVFYSKAWGEKVFAMYFNNVNYFKHK